MPRYDTEVQNKDRLMASPIGEYFSIHRERIGQPIYTKPIKRLFRRGQSRLTNIDGWSGGGLDGVMARRLRYQAAVYHVMARGDGGKTALEYDKDR